MRTYLFALLFFLLPAFAHGAEPAPSNRTKPPFPPPAQVETSLYLWKIDNVDEKDELFSASLYLNLKWRDPRNAGENQQPITYTEEAAEEKLQEIWWPEWDFINASETKINNRSLTIYPDGTVEYSLKIFATFFTPMDFKRFPFDHQIFKIRIASFLWTSDQLTFVVDEKNSGYAKDKFLDKFTLLSVSMDTEKIVYLNENYNEFVFSLHLQRHTKFYLYQILIPLFIVLAISVVMFFGSVEDLSSQLFLGQGGLLVLIAMKFMINETLPSIAYLTILDYIFFMAYLMCGIAIGIACVYNLRFRKTHQQTGMSHHMPWFSVVLFFLLYVLLFFLLAYK